jgi:hypothetical protein
LVYAAGSVHAEATPESARSTPVRNFVATVVVGAVLIAACSADDQGTIALPTATAIDQSAVDTVGSPTPPQAGPESSTTSPVTTEVVESAYPRPDWLGTIVLEPLTEGSAYGVAGPTPPELVDRQVATIDFLPRPVGEEFFSEVQPIPDDVLARSTWEVGCPMQVEDLSYIQMSFRGFDREIHMGEMIVHWSVADDIVTVFEALFDAGYPIEEMRVMTREDFSAPPTGDTNITSGYECRQAVGGSGAWSNHAVGLAVDVNPFHNPYRKGDLVLPELADAYFDRDNVRPGMILASDDTFNAFTAIGWEWGGSWSSAIDYMHFSWNGK